MLFTPNQTLLDGYDRYEAGVEYDVPEEKAGYFVSLGWGDAPDLPRSTAGPWSEPATVTLRPENAVSASEADA